MDTKIYNVYIPFWKKDEYGKYDQRHIHTQVEAISEDSAINDVKKQFEINNKGYNMGKPSVIKLNTGFIKRDMISFGNLLLNEVDRKEKKEHMMYYFDKWYMDYKVHRFDK